MIERKYYLVIKMVKHCPLFITCTISSDQTKFIRIDDLSEYMKNGGGLSSDVFDRESCEFYLIQDEQWRNYLKL